MNKKVWAKIGNKVMESVQKGVPHVKKAQHIYKASLGPQKRPLCRPSAHKTDWEYGLICSQVPTKRPHGVVVEACLS